MRYGSKVLPIHSRVLLFIQFWGGHNFQADSKILVKKQRAKVDKTILKNTKVEDSHCQFQRYRKATAMSRVY